MNKQVFFVSHNLDIILIITLFVISLSFNIIIEVKI